jgi:hypothetical protein
MRGPVGGGPERRAGRGIPIQIAPRSGLSAAFCATSHFCEELR